MASKKDTKKIKPNADKNLVKSGNKRKATEEGMVPNIKKKMDESIIELNVGGQLVSTLSSTLNKGSKIFNHMSRDKTGRHFIDCDFDAFKYVLDFLRNENNLPTPEMTLKVYDLAKDIECESLVEKLESYHAVQYRNEMVNKGERVNERYGKLKKKIIEDIEKLDVGPGQDKAVHLCSRYVQTCCKPIVEDGFRARNVIVYANIIYENEILQGDSFPLLAYELATLGVAKYVIRHEYKKHCKSCKTWSDWQLIILLSH